MSRSPKYTAARMRGQAQARVAEQQRRREEERRKATAVAEQQRRDAAASRARGDLAAAAVGLAALALIAAQTGLSAEVQALRAQADNTAEPGPVTDDSALKKLQAATARIEAESAALSGQVADELARTCRREALDAIERRLSEDARRSAFDEPGAAAVDGVLRQAGNASGDEDFLPLYQRLSEEVGKHLATVRANRNAVEALRLRAEAGREALSRVLKEAEEGGIELSEPERAAAAAGRATAMLEVEWPGRGALDTVRADLSELDGRTGELSAELDARLAALDRVVAVAEATIQAAPLAGLQILEASVIREGDRVMFRTVRTDDRSDLDVLVAPGAGEIVSISYRGTGADFRTEFTADGEERICDRTERILKDLHEKLLAQDVETDGLRWDGKPELRSSAVVQRPEQGGRRAHG